MSDTAQNVQAQNPKVLIITALITAVTTILVAFLGIFPQLRGGDREAIKNLQENVATLTEKLKSVNPSQASVVPAKKMSVDGTVYTSANKKTTLSGMDVYLLPEDYGLVGHTGEDGRFNIQKVPEGVYSIILRDPTRGNSGKVLLDDPREELSVMGKLVKYHIQ